MAGKPVSEERVQQCLRTVKVIAASKSVERYVIGYTTRSSWKRFGQYRKNGCSHIVVIADRLTNFQAYALEMTLQQRAWSNERSILFKKYDPTRRRKGGWYGAPQSIANKNDNHSIYMAWWERDPHSAYKSDV
jgi:hypothetical protein